MIIVLGPGRNRGNRGRLFLSVLSTFSTLLENAETAENYEIHQILGFNYYLPFLYIQMPQINVYTVNHSTPYPKGS